MVNVEVLTEVDQDVLQALNALLPQLSSSAPPITMDQLVEIVRSDASHLLIARDDNEVVVGALTLVVFRIPTGLRAWVEDVVVDSDARGTGVGEALNRSALAMAHDLGARTVDLTSRPTREAANRLYQKLGFEARETNVYRYTLEG